MPRMTPCMASGCPELIPVGVGRCEAHARPKWQNKSRHTLERPKDWWARRARVLRRDRHRCQWPDCARKATHVDHKVPVSRGGSWEADNLQSLCVEHHAEKTKAERRSA